jgi:hypothetical protein
LIFGSGPEQLERCFHIASRFFQSIAFFADSREMGEPLPVARQKPAIEELG